MTPSTRTSTTGLALTLALFTGAGCGAPEEEGLGAQSFGDVTSPLFIDRATVTPWPSGTMPVCWGNTSYSNFNVLSRRVRDAFLSTWRDTANLQVTGWHDTCASPRAGVQQVFFRTDGSSDANVGKTSPNFGRFTTSTRRLGLGMDAQNGTTGSSAAAVVAHEFGHTFGFSHEFARNDWNGSNCPTPSPPGVEGPVSGDKLGTGANDQSIMTATYCGVHPGTLSAWDMVGAERVYGARTRTFRTLVNYWSGANLDHGLAALAGDKATLEGQGYVSAYTEGWIPVERLVGTVPLNLFFHAGRGDFHSTTADTVTGYTKVGVVGNVYTTQVPGTVPLQHFWHAGRGDNLLTISPQLRAAALGAGYTQVAGPPMGYVFATKPFKTLNWYHDAGRGDHLMAAVGSQLMKDASGYTWRGGDISIMSFQVPNTVAFRNYWNAARGDNFQGTSAPDSSGYVATEILGYTFSPNTQSPGTNGMVPFSRYWHSGNQDYVLTGNATTGNTLSNAGYQQAVGIVNPYGLRAP